MHNFASGFTYDNTFPMKKVLFFPLICLFLLGSLSANSQTTASDSADIRVAEGVLKMADWANFDYKNILKKAAGGDVAAIVEMIDFHRFVDGMDGTNHGVTCLELIPVAGDRIFASAIPINKPALTKLLLKRLMVAQNRTQQSELRKDLSEWAPYTWATLNGLPLPVDPEEERKKLEEMESTGIKSDALDAAREKNGVRTGTGTESNSIMTTPAATRDSSHNNRQ